MTTATQAKKLLYTKTEAATVLNMSTRQIDRFVRAGVLPFVKVGRVRRFPVEIIEQRARFGVEMPKRAS